MVYTYDKLQLKMELARRVGKGEKQGGGGGGGK
jgi:hypothetical protein